MNEKKMKYLENKSRLDADREASRKKAALENNFSAFQQKSWEWIFRVYSF